MSAPTRTTRVPATFHEDATVLRAGRDGLAVRTADGEERSAARAVSCVVEPREGDRVMMASLHDGAAFVIAVLQRPGDPSAVWSGAGDVTVAAPQGRVAVAAAHGVDVLTGGEVRIDADSLGVVTRAADLAAEAVTFAGGVVASRLDHLKLSARTVDQVVGRLSQKLERAYRTVTELDQLRAENADWSLRGTLALHAANLVATAKTLVKIDGDQIHLG